MDFICDHFDRCKTSAAQNNPSLYSYDGSELQIAISAFSVDPVVCNIDYTIVSVVKDETSVFATALVNKVFETLGDILATAGRANV